MESATAKPHSKSPLDLTFLDADVLIRHTTDTGKILPAALPTSRPRNSATSRRRSSAPATCC